MELPRYVDFSIEIELGVKLQIDDDEITVTSIKVNGDEYTFPLQKDATKELIREIARDGKLVETYI